MSASIVARPANKPETILVSARADRRRRHRRAVEIGVGRPCGLVRGCLFGRFILRILCGLSAAGFCDLPVFFGGAAGVNAAGCGAISGAALADGGAARKNRRRGRPPPVADRRGLRPLPQSDPRAPDWCGRRPPRDRRCLSPFADSGKTGPTSGRAPAVPDFGAVSGAGSATGATWVDITRRNSWST